MTKPRALRPLVPNSNVETLCMAMFCAGVTETSYPAHPGLTGSELGELSQLTTEQATSSAAWMARCGRAVITTPDKLSYRRYALSAAQAAQCAATLRGQVPQRPKVPLSEQIIKFLAGARQLTSSEIVSLATSLGWGSGSVYNLLSKMWKQGELQRSGPSGCYTYSLPTQPAEHTKPAETVEGSTPVTIESHIIEFLAGGHRFTSGEIASSIASFGFDSSSVFSRLTKMWKQGKLQRSGVPGYYAYSLPTQSAEHTKPAEHTEPAETAEPSNSDHTEPSIVQATIDAFHQAGEPLSDEQIEALHHMHPDRHRVLCDRVAAKAKAKARQEREAREARETALFEEYLQAAVEAEQMDLLDT